MIRREQSFAYLSIETVEEEKEVISANNAKEKEVSSSNPAQPPRPVTTNQNLGQSLKEKPKDNESTRSKAFNEKRNEMLKQAQGLRLVTERQQQIREQWKERERLAMQSATYVSKSSRRERPVEGTVIEVRTHRTELLTELSSSSSKNLHPQTNPARPELESRNKHKEEVKVAEMERTGRREKGDKEKISGGNTDAQTKEEPTITVEVSEGKQSVREVPTTTDIRSSQSKTEASAPPNALRTKRKNMSDSSAEQTASVRKEWKNVMLDKLEEDKKEDRKTLIEEIRIAKKEKLARDSSGQHSSTKSGSVPPLVSTCSLPQLHAAEKSVSVSPLVTKLGSKNIFRLMFLTNIDLVTNIYMAHSNLPLSKGQQAEYAFVS